MLNNLQTQLNNLQTQLNNEVNARKTGVQNALNKAAAAQATANGKADVNHNHDNVYVKSSIYNSHYHFVTSGSHYTTEVNGHRHNIIFGTASTIHTGAPRVKMVKRR